MERTRIQWLIGSIAYLVSLSTLSCQNESLNNLGNHEILQYAIIDSSDTHVLHIELAPSLRPFSGIVEMATQQAVSGLCDSLFDKGKTKHLKIYYTDVDKMKRISGSSMRSIQLFKMCDEFHSNNELKQLTSRLFTAYTPSELLVMDKESHEILNSFENTNLPYTPNGNSLSGLLLPLLSKNVDSSTKQLLTQHIYSKSELLKALLHASNVPANDK